MPAFDAHTAWFTIELNGRTDFQVFSFTGREAVSRPYEFVIEIVHPSYEEDLTDFLGATALLAVADRSGAPRLVHGLVREMRMTHSGNHLSHYQCVVVPRFWFLSLTRDHRIFQHKSVPDIITRILQEQNFAAETFAFKCFHSYPPREYCVQYGESDLHFISRLCEEDGIYYYFEHSEDGHCLCFSDMPGGPAIPGESDLRYHPGSGQPADTAVVARAALIHQTGSDKATYRDWNFLTPALGLEASADEPAFAKAPVAPGIDYDTYQYPHLYQTLAEGQRYAAIQLLRQLTFHTRLEAESDASRFLPGYTFRIHDHDKAAINAEWWIMSVELRGEQPQALGREAPDRGMSCSARVAAIPANVRFVPALAHLKNRLWGDQTAIVTGPAGEEIYPDEHGRVKVQFFWDREGNMDENTTCWIRASQGWAGPEFGTLALPRIGQEVIVSFLEGDPDRPLITGRLYNAAAMPPNDLPAYKTRTTFKSMSSPGGQGQRGFNELILEDKAGQEQIYVHAEKDVNVHVNNDWKEHILRDKHLTVDNNIYVRTEGETHETLKSPRKTEIHADDNLTVHADSHTKTDGKWLVEAGAEVHLYAGDKAVFNAGSQATLQAGGSFIHLDPSGAYLNGPVLNLGAGGSPGGGTKAAPQTPDLPLLVETGENPAPAQAASSGPERTTALVRSPAQPKKIKVEGELRIGVFFDGSGADKDWNTDFQPYTNIAKLYDLYPREIGKYHRIYAPGIGVRRSSSDTEPASQDMSDNPSFSLDVVSLAFGVGGAGGNADTVWGLMRNRLMASLDRLEKSTITGITLDVFGFSRGAALARHFVNAVLAYGLPDPAPGRRTISGGIPAQYKGVWPNLLVQYDPAGQYITSAKLDCALTIGFVGLFDTVGSFYWPKNFDEGHFKLLLPDAVQSCAYQIAAADEYREHYALYTLKGFADQEDMPGCHSDIGGGYAISTKPEDKARNRHGATYIYLGKADVDTQFGHPNIRLYVPGDPPLQALCHDLLTDFIEEYLADKRWRSMPKARKEAYAQKREKAGIRFSVSSVFAGNHEFSVTILKIKEEVVDLRYVYLQKMHEKALSCNVPFDPIDTDIVQKIPESLTLAQTDYPSFWERYIHLSAQGSQSYAHCYTATADGRIILRPDLTPDQMPKTAFASFRLSPLVMGMTNNGVRACCDNRGVVGDYMPERSPL